MKNSKKIIIIITGIAILVAGILCKQEFFLMIPLFISLFVMGFQSEANRLGALAGAINSLIYTAAYIYMGVYASAASAVLFSFPIQLMTFFRWKKKAYKKTVVFRRMSTKMRLLCAFGFIALWTALAIAFVKLDYEYAILDSGSFLMGFITPVLTMIEYTYLWLVSAVVGLLLSVQMVVNDYKETTYLIYSVYCFYCIICAFINVRKFYNEQQSQLKGVSE